VLLENRGHIVEKKELLRQVWPDTFVEENNLAFNISVLRKLLGDSGTSSRYIETVPKRGYRFIAELAHEETPTLGQARSNPEEPISSGTPHVTSQRSLTAKIARPRIVFAMVLLAVAVTLLTLRLRSSQKLTAKDTIVLADFANNTGESVFDGTLRQAFTIQLEQSPFISLISDQRVQHTLRLMNQPAGIQLSPELARDVCERTGSAAVLEGSITRLGTAYVLSFRAKHCASGEVFDNDQAQVAKKEDVLDAVSRIARNFRSRIGESLANLKHDAPLIEVTTPSLEALKAYSSSIRVGYARGCAASVPYGRLAVELDPQFAMAHSHLGRCYVNLGESVLGNESIAKAYGLQKRATDRERFYIIGNYQRQVLGNLRKAQETTELWAQTYPRDARAHATLAGTIYEGLGKYRQAIQEAETAIALDPDLAPAYVSLGFANVYLDRPAQAAKAIQRASERDLDTPDLLLLDYYTAFLRDDNAGMQRAAARATGRAGAEDSMSNTQALFLARSGQLELAGKMSRRAIDLAEQTGQHERAATYQTAAAVWNALFGNAAAARQNAIAALSRSNGRDVEYGAAFALALAGDCARSQALANDLDRRFPEDTFVRFTYLPILHALFALENRQPHRAIEQLEIAAPEEPAVPGINIFAFFGSLYSAYVRGQAYLALHQGNAAVAEFEKLLDHRGIVLADPAGAVARLQLARAFVSAGNNEKAKIAYDDLLALWKNADPGIPLVEQARSERLKLAP
ncbi:MAG: winged helix-turn-helix domain-containing protein, partial [Acidobacteriaceae bacterium]|nr:winged helix-turn-helix domain-containing protein [Acidobacteriaceae bacterium]